MYSKKLYAGWADMDFNSHMSNTAYLDKAADVMKMENSVRESQVPEVG